MSTDNTTSTNGPDEPDEPTTSVELARPLDALRDRPDTIAQAIERAARIDALTAWLKDLRDDVRHGYVDATARTVEQTTGGSFNAPVKGVGVAYRTQPQPAPTIVDSDAFARWYVSELLDADPDSDRDHTHDDDGEVITPPRVVHYDDRVARRTVASCDSSELLTFLHAVAAADSHGDRDTHSTLYAAAVGRLVESIDVVDEWLVGQATLDDLLAGKLYAVGDAPRLVCDTKALTCVDRLSGELVPGVVVKPAPSGVLTIKPDTKLRKRLRGELDELLGPAALRE